MEKSPFEGKLWLVVIGTLAMIVFFCTLKTLVDADDIEGFINDDPEPEKAPVEAPVPPNPPAKPDAPVTGHSKADAPPKPPVAPDATADDDEPVPE